MEVKMADREKKSQAQQALEANWENISVEMQKMNEESSLSLCFETILNAVETCRRYKVLEKAYPASAILFIETKIKENREAQQEKRQTKPL